MTKRSIGVSLSERTIRSLDKLARSEGVSRSGAVEVAVERASLAFGVPEVRVGGLRFVPEKR
jgi:hypothetical protein